MNYARLIGLCLNLTAVISLLSGCNRELPQQVKVDTIGLQNQHTTAQNGVRRSQSLLAEVEAGADAGFLRPYAYREGWATRLKEAQNALNSSHLLLQNNVTPLVTRNQASDATALQAEIDKVARLIEEVHSKAGYVQRRIQELRNLKSNGPLLFNQARRDHRETETLVAQATAGLQRSARLYPSKSTELRGQIAAFAQTKTTSARQLQLARTEFENLQRGRPVQDEVLLASCRQVTSSKEKTLTEWTNLQRKLAELPLSYSQTLVDMRIDYYVQINRESWDESSESELTTEYRFPPKQVDKPTYEHFATFADDQVLATQGIGWFSSGFKLSSGVDNGYWTTVVPNPQESLHHSTAEWSLDGVDEKCFHKYLIMRDGVAEYTDWQEVSGAYFDTHENDLGMDICSKAIGTYNSETSNFASPPGLTYVNTPVAGQWRSATGGVREWEFRGNYALFNTLLGHQNRYRYSQWTEWDQNYRGRKPYYGTKQQAEEEEQYGTHSRSVGGNSYYSRSYWISSGEYRSQGASVRGAGRDARGGGPGGGGK